MPSSGSSGRLLRRAFGADALANAIAGPLLLVGGESLGQLLGLPPDLLQGAGGIMLPAGAVLAWLAAQDRPPRLLVWFFVAGNSAWALLSLTLLGEEGLAPIGIATVVGQALLVLSFAALQLVGFRRTQPST